ncbi:MAG: mechanosensitive ion channel domain-containing protein [Stellaceae bacterium]
MTIETALRSVWIFLAALLIAVPITTARAAHSGGSGTEPAKAGPPPQVQALLNLLADPTVQKWLEKESAAAPAAQPAHGKHRVSAPDYFSAHIAAIREHIVALAAVIPDLPNQFERARGLVRAELGERGRAKVVLRLALFVALGFIAEWIFRQATSRVRRRLDNMPVATVRHRLRLIAARFAFAVGLVAAFALGSVGPFLALDWAPLLREMLLGYLVAFLILRIAVITGHFLLAPGHERFRIIPMDETAARFWCGRFAGFVGWFAFGWVTVGLGRTLEYSLEARQLLAYAFGLVLLAIALEATWRRPVAAHSSADVTPPGEAQRLGRSAQNALLSIAFVLLWALWVMRAMPAFWLLAILVLLPLASGVTRRAVDQLLRPPGSPHLDAELPSVTAVCIERGMRALLIIGAVLVLAWGWGIPLQTLAGEDTPFSRILHGVLSAIIIVLVADVLWQAMKAAIDGKLAGAAEPGLPNTEETRRRARLRTLLPIFRNVLFVVVIVVAVLMALAAMGVQIGPLIAGLGVLGVAIGFGAQSLVRDVIAGMFYLLDDAFRVGEYIQSGNYKGTVESFSFRSVRLRHQRGPLYTVPFALLGAVQNMSRDWVIDKLTVGITYDSDIDKARKLIKQIGLELAEEPEFKPVILEPLKMQGVDAFGDFAVQIRMKMMTLPGENFVIRRQALARIKKAFDANGIKFAYPTVQLAGDGEPAAAAVAQQALQFTHPAAAAAE